MKTEFIPYEQALALKELGFNENCFAHFVKHYNEIKCILNSDDFDEWWTNNSDNLECKAPLYQQAFRWFREKGFHCAIMPKITPSNSVVYYMYEGKPKKNWDNCFETYEEAELACLNKLIEIVKNK